MQILANGVVAGSLYALVALGFSIIFQVTRTFDFSLAATMTIGAFSAAIFIDHALNNVILAVAFGCFVAAMVGALLEVVIYRSFRHAENRALVLILVSLGVMVILINIVALVFGDKFRIVGEVITSSTTEIFTARITPLQLGSVGAMVLSSIACWWVYKCTTWGVTMRAVASNLNLALCFGIRTERMILQATILGTALGAMAAGLSAVDTGLTPSIGFQILLPGVVASIVGGIGRLSGATISGLIIGIIEQSSGWFISTGWQQAILFVILIMFLILRPEGLFGMPLRRKTI
jgi:branched-chain amino acid transport system permease protein